MRKVCCCDLDLDGLGDGLVDKKEEILILYTIFIRNQLLFPYIQMRFLFRVQFDSLNSSTSKHLHKNILNLIS